MSRIASITSVQVTHYIDNEQTIAYVNWVDTRGKTGTTLGDPDGTHMKALIDRALREGAPVEYDEAGWLPNGQHRRNGLPGWGYMLESPEYHTKLVQAISDAGYSGHDPLYVIRELNEWRKTHTGRVDHTKNGRAAELHEMQDLLRRAGYDPSDAQRLQSEGMGPSELEHRLKERGGLARTHGLRKVSR